MGQVAVIDQAPCPNCGGSKLHTSSGRFNAQTGEYLEQGSSKLTFEGVGAIVVSAIFGLLAYAPLVDGPSGWDDLRRSFFLVVGIIFFVSGVVAVVLDRIRSRAQVVHGISSGCRLCGYRCRLGHDLLYTLRHHRCHLDALPGAFKVRQDPDDIPYPSRST